MTKKLALLTAAIIMLAAAPAFTQVVGQQNEVVTPNTRPTEREAPAPAAVPAPAPAPVAQCTAVTLNLPAIDTKAKPASYSPTFRDSADGFVDAMKACNPRSTVNAPVADSSKTVVMTVTQGADGVAQFKLPTDRLARILITFHVGTPNWDKHRAWGVTGPVGNRTDLVMSEQDEKTFPKLSTKM